MEIDRLDASSFDLPPLKVGDFCFIQKQMGNNPNEWDWMGMVIETDENDQYLVRVDGSRRLTLHNRKFLSKAKQYTTPEGLALPSPYLALLPLLAPPQVALPVVQLSVMPLAACRLPQVADRPVIPGPPTQGNSTCTITPSPSSPAFHGFHTPHCARRKILPISLDTPVWSLVTLVRAPPDQPMQGQLQPTRQPQGGAWLIRGKGDC